MGALQALVVFGQVAGEILFGEADGGIGLEIALYVFFDGVLLAGEGGGCLFLSMSYRILACDLLTGVGSWPRGQFRIGLVCRYLGWVDILVSPCRSKTEWLPDARVILITSRRRTPTNADKTKSLICGFSALWVAGRDSRAGSLF
jgi:hypothetical protein